MDQTSFGVLLRTSRRGRGLSQRDLARLLRCDPTYVSHLERGVRAPLLDLVQQIADVLELSDVEYARLAAAAGYWTPVQRRLFVAAYRAMRAALDELERRLATLEALLERTPADEREGGAERLASPLSSEAVSDDVDE